MSQIQQLHLQFLPSEDRLLLTVNSTENEDFYFLLTRRYIALLFPVLNKVFNAIQKEPSTVSQQLTYSKPDRKKANPVTEAETEKPTTTTTQQKLKQLPNTAIKDAILLAKISTRIDEDNNVILLLLPEQGDGINLTMDQRLTLQIQNLLQEVMPKTEWNLETIKNYPNALIHPENKQVLH